MHRFVAFTFDLQPKAGQTSRECLAEARDEVSSWLTACLRRCEVDLPVRFDGLRLTQAGHEIRTDERDCSTHHLTSCEWDFCWPAESGLLWSFSFVAACDASDVHVSFLVHAGWRSGAIRPVHASLGGSNPLVSLSTPRDKLILGGNARLNGRPIPLRARLLRKGQVEKFVNEDLLDAGRPLPIVLFSLGGPLNSDQATLQAAQDKLLGLAHVVALADQSAVQRFARAAGPAYTAEQVMRIYWPGLAFDGSDQSHPFLTFEQFRKTSDDVMLSLLSTIAPVAADACREGALIRAAREALARDAARQGGPAVVQRLAQLSDELEQVRQEERRSRNDAESSARHVRALLDELVDLRAQIAALRASLASGPDQADQALGELAVELDRAWEEGTRLRAELETARRQAAELETEFRSHLDVCAMQDEPSAEARETSRRFDNVLAALRAAETENGDVLTVWEDAEHSAGRSTFARPEQVFEALQAIAEVGREYFAARDGGPALGPVEQAFRKRIPYKYTAFESQTTLTLFGSDRVFHHHGVSRQMQRHLTIGGGDRNNCLQIYFEFDDATRRVLVGYCGRHLPYSKMRT